MKKIKIEKHNQLKGEAIVPADKSISHRAVMIASISNGTTFVSNFLKSEDCLWTIDVFRKLGIEIIQKDQNSYHINSNGYDSLKQPEDDLYFGNSGTGLRLTSGILAGSFLSSVLTGDDSLSLRPLKRITQPLRMMGADIQGPEDAGHLPLTIKGKKLKGINYVSPVSSAQVKSSLLLAGLNASGPTSITEPFKSRDHTENMLKAFGADIEIDGLKVTVNPIDKLKARDIKIPADISSAAFFIIAALITENSEIMIKNVGVNKTRTGLLDILQRMEADLSIINKAPEAIEPLADICVKSSELKPFIIEKNMIPRLIDEIPILMVAATQAHGTSQIKDAAELRVKETDRIESMTVGLSKMGAKIDVQGNDIYITGPTSLRGAEIDSYSDHRTAMSFLIAGLVSRGTTEVIDTDCIETSFPDFFKNLMQVIM
ncbi:MAG: 3-phosphoshikimate 1-carboxyvinyltransferase [Candidatus Kappaea frigidicola]|nr:3-phosphoshikimate 1-carboxyvinyltransferase [Candidatus Kappaea frigidicola]